MFVNFDAGRNYLDLNDVHLYDSFEGLFEALEHFEPYQAKSLFENTRAERQFVAKINATCF